MKIFKIGVYKIIIEDKRSILYKEDKLIFCLNGCSDENEFFDIILDKKILVRN